MFQYRCGLISLRKLESCLRPIRTNESLVLLGNCFQLYGAGYPRSIELLNYISSTWEKTYVIPGITEICGNGLRSCMRNLDEFSTFIESSPNKNVSILNNTEIHDGDLLLVGSTFWAGAPSNDQMIRKYPQLVNKELNSWSQDDAVFIGNAIRMASNQKKNLIIATYYGYSTIKKEPAIINSFFDSISGFPNCLNSSVTANKAMETIEDIKGGWVFGTDRP